MGDYSVLSLWRYPVKSMAGEELEAVEVTARGLNGDRAYALVDTAAKKVRIDIAVLADLEELQTRTPAA